MSTTHEIDTKGLGPGDVLRIPEGAEQQEVRMMLDAAARARRNVRIRRAYEAMRNSSGRFPDGYEAARESVAERFDVSDRTVERALKGY